METKVNYAFVGAFVLSLLAAIVFSIIWLSSDVTLKRYTIYKVYMNESVSGLSVDSAVEYNGVNIGNIISMDINHQNPQLVELLLKIKSDAPITEGTRATLNSRGLTGLTYLALKDQGKNLEPLKTLPGEDYPVILTSPSLFLRLDTALSDLAKNVRQITTSIKSVFSDENQKSFRYILQGTANTLQLLDQQTLPAANQALSNMSNMSNGLSEMTTELKRNPALLIRGREKQPLGPGE